MDESKQSTISIHEVPLNKKKTATTTFNHNSLWTKEKSFNQIIICVSVSSNLILMWQQKATHTQHFARHSGPNADYIYISMWRPRMRTVRERDAKSAAIFLIFNE